MNGIFLPVSAVEELLDGDLVLHNRYGLARFEGTRSIIRNEAKHTLLILRFAEEAVYWESVDRLENLEKYIGRTDPEPALDKLGSSTTAKTKLRLLVYQDTHTRQTKSPSTRIGIRESVRHEVWRRDQGRCVRCGSREKLEFDHIVPFSKGGSDTARNIELLCENCNRSKGARI